MRASVALILALILAGCMSPVSPNLGAPEAVGRPVARCEADGIKIDTDFAAGALQSCSIDADGAVTATIAPEDAPPINCSPWYAFRVTTVRPRDIKVRLKYTECGHRYWPKRSLDRQNWERLPDEAVSVTEVDAKDEAVLTLTTTGDPVFVAAQEIMVPQDYADWLTTLEKHPSLTRGLLGKSAQGRDIEIVHFGNPKAREQVVLVGRQHPPEVTGALAMQVFTESLLEDTTLTHAFRERFRVTAVPLVNPDGVVHGYWRHNTGGVDLNRDWGPFTQPETQLMKGVLQTIDENPDQALRLVLDFHSTGRDIFYTIPDELPTDPELFTSKWLERYPQLMPDYKVVRDARHTVGRPISKAYSFDAYGVPAITFEIGDETDRELIKRIGRQSAIAMMETLLKAPQP